MARRPEGWTLRRDERTGIYTVRFRMPDGRRVHRSTGCRDRAEAQAAGAAIFRAAGDQGPRRVASGRRDLATVAAEWTRDYGAEHSPETTAAVEAYAAVHWISRWRHLDELDALALAAYVRDRLRVVTASTVRKEASALRSLLTWAQERGYVTEAPRVPSVPKRATGTAYDAERTPRRVDLTPEQLRALIAAMPTENARGYPVRDVVALAWETGLRIGTIQRITRPRHYRPGRETLFISADIDKARQQREQPITDAARVILDRHATEDGLVFGKGSLRHSLEQAALEIGIPPDDARRVSPHDIRHASASFLASRPGVSIAGVAYLLGHRHVSTTARYTHPGIDAAKQALAAASGTPIGTRKRGRPPKPPEY